MHLCNRDTCDMAALTLLLWCAREWAKDAALHPRRRSCCCAYYTSVRIRTRYFCIDAPRPFWGCKVRWHNIYAPTNHPQPPCSMVAGRAVDKCKCENIFRRKIWTKPCGAHSTNGKTLAGVAGSVLTRISKAPEIRIQKQQQSQHKSILFLSNSLPLSLRRPSRPFAHHHRRCVYAINTHTVLLFMLGHPAANTPSSDRILCVYFFRFIVFGTML